MSPTRSMAGRYDDMLLEMARSTRSARCVELGSFRFQAVVRWARVYRDCPPRRWGEIVLTA